MDQRSSPDFQGNKKLINGAQFTLQGDSFRKGTAGGNTEKNADNSSKNQDAVIRESQRSNKGQE